MPTLIIICLIVFIAYATFFGKKGIVKHQSLLNVNIKIESTYKEQEKRFDWLNVLLVSIKTHDQLCEFHLIVDKTLKTYDYHTLEYQAIKKDIEEKESDLRLIRQKEGESILKTVKL